MTLIRLFATAAPAFIALTLNAAAAPEAYTFDKNHTEVRFCWNHLGVSRQCAHFLKYDGELLYDEANPENSTVKVTFLTDSIETFIPLFNEHMKAEKLFDAKKFPEITFKSTKFEKTGEKTGKVTGDLTIKDVTKSVVLKVKLLGFGPGMRGAMLSGWEASTTLNRNDFGITTFPKVLGDDVGVAISVEADLAKG